MDIVKRYTIYFVPELNITSSVRLKHETGVLMAALFLFVEARLKSHQLHLAVMTMTKEKLKFHLTQGVMRT
jgi:hypothetical protein